MNDTFAKHTSGLESPASHIADVTPDDAADLERASRAINVAQAGSVKITTTAGTTATLYVAAGITFPVRATRIWATDTTALGIVALS